MLGDGRIVAISLILLTSERIGRASSHNRVRGREKLHLLVLPRLEPIIVNWVGEFGRWNAFHVFWPFGYVVSGKAVSFRIEIKGYPPRMH